MIDIVSVVCAGPSCVSPVTALARASPIGGPAVDIAVVARVSAPLATARSELSSRDAHARAAAMIANCLVPSSSGRVTGLLLAEGEIEVELGPGFAQGCG